VPKGSVPLARRQVFKAGAGSGAWCKHLPGGYSWSMSRVLKWNGKDVPEELRSLPAGRYVVEAIDEAPALTPEEEEGLVEALRALDRGEGESSKEVRRAIGRALKR